MSLTTWTPAAIASKATIFAESLSRFFVKNAQTSISKITDTEDELILIEGAITRQASRYKNSARDLHPLMQLPFTAKPYAGGSRFRAQFDPGVFYGADSIETAAAERGYHHHLFIKSSPELINSGATAFTFFTAKISTKLVDVRKAPFKKSSYLFHNKDSYTDSQAFASLVRQSGVPGIKYSSVRNPNTGECVALFSPSAFASKQPSTWDENWLCIADSTGARWINNSSRSIVAPMSFTYV